MNAEQLGERIAERRRQLQAMIQERQRLTNEIMGLQGAIIELERMAAEMEQESEGEEKLPEPDESEWERLGLLDHCTCDEYDWPEEPDPYELEINEREVLDTMCPYCYQERLHAI